MITSKLFLIKVPTQEAKIKLIQPISKAFQNLLYHFCLFFFFFLLFFFFLKHLFMLGISFQSHLISHSSVQSTFRDTQKTLRHSRHSDSSWTLEHSDGTWTLKYLKGTRRALERSRHVESTWPPRALQAFYQLTRIGLISKPRSPFILVSRQIKGTVQGNRLSQRAP